MGKHGKKKKHSAALEAPVTVPNLFYTAVHHDVIRKLPGFVGLPQEAATVAPEGPQGLRFQRQDTDTWHAAHVGVLSTGIAGAILGFKEEKVAKRMGCGGFCGHSYMVAAVQHLAQPPHPSMSTTFSPNITQQTNTTATGPDQRIDSCAGLTQAIVNANARTGTDSSSPATFGSDTCIPRPPAPPPLPAAGTWEGRALEELFTICARAAREGLATISQTWGHVQEGAALWGLMQVLPHAVVHEVGMCVVEPRDLPQHWGFASGSLPPLAASPDALLCHPVPCRHCATQQQLCTDHTSMSAQQHSHCPLTQLQHALTSCQHSHCRAHRAATSAGVGSSVGNSSGEPCCAQCTAAGAGAGGASSTQWADPPCVRQLKHSCQRQLRQLLEDHQQLAVGSSGQAHCDGTDLSEHSSSESGSEQSESGSVCEEQQSGDSEQQSANDEFATDGASVVGPATQQCTSHAEYQGIASTISSGGVSVQLLNSPTPIVLLPPLDTPAPSTDTDSVMTTDDANCSRNSRQGEEAEHQRQQVQSAQGGGHCAGQCQVCCGRGVYVEVVEIKNTCPFRQTSRRSGAKGRCKVEWCMSDRGPRDKLPPYWVPQLQLHMLATRCQSALLLSRSVRGGLRLWRMWRDDEYLYRMLVMIQRVYQGYVLTRRMPPPNVLMSEPGYQSLLDNSCRLSRSATCVGYWPGPAPVYPGSDLRSLVSTP